MSQTKLIFSILFSLHIVLCQVGIGDFKSLSIITLPIIIIWTLVYLCLYLNKKTNFWKNIENLDDKGVPFNLWGIKLDKDDSERKESSLLQNIKLEVRAKRIIFSIVFSVLLSFLIPLIYNNYFSLAVIVLYITGIALINVSFVGHFLFISVINTCFLYIAFAINTDISATIVIIDTIVMIGLFANYSLLENESILFKLSNNLLYNIFVKTFKVSLGLGIIYLSLAFILPEKITFFNKKQVIDKVSKVLSKSSGTKFKIPKINNSISNIPKSVLDKSAVEFQLENILKRIDSIDKAFSNIPNIPLGLKGDLSNIKFDIQNTQNDLKRLKSGSNISLEDTIKIVNKLKSLESKLDNLNTSFDKYEHSLVESMDKYPTKVVGDLTKDLLQAGAKDKFSDLEDITSKLKDETQKLNQITKEKLEVKEQINNRIEKQKSLQSMVIKKEVKNKRKINTWWENLKKLIYSFIIIFVIVLLNYLFGKRRPVEDELISRDESLKLLKSLKKLKNENLSANEEVIKSYNIFKETVKNSSYSELEVPPPEVLFKILSKNRAKLRDHSWLVTNTFCDCYYGTIQTSGSQLISFRKSFYKLIKAQI
jgi:hypothetical protein